MFNRIRSAPSSFGKKLIFACLLFTLANGAEAQTLVSAPATQAFGQVEVNSAATATQTLSYVSSGAVTPTFSLVYGTEYVLGSPNCAASNTVSCTISVEFQPHWPGSREDAVLVKDRLGNVIATTLLYGTGLGPQIALYPGTISTIAGTPGVWGYSGDRGPATEAVLSNPQGIATDNFGNLYIADSINQVVRQVNATTGQISTIVGSGAAGYAGDGGPAVKATLNTPVAVALDGAGNLYIADQGNNAIRKVSAATQQITTVAGGGAAASGPDGLGDGGLATSALLWGPNDVAVDGAGNLYIADSFDNLIRRVDAASGIITVAAGAGLRNPTGVAVDAAGNLFVADSGNSMVRRVGASSGTMTVAAGTGTYGYSGDLGPAASAKLGSPVCVRLDAAGNLYIVDQGKNVIRQVNAQSGTISTIVGTGAPGFFGDGGGATGAALKNPTGVALDSLGNIYVADYANNVIRKVSKLSGLVFPSTLVGETSPLQTLTALNIGNQLLNFASLTISSNFSQQLPGGANCSSSAALPAGGTCMIAIDFIPAKSGNLSGSLTLTDNSLNATSTTQSIALTGTGSGGTVPQLSFSSASLTFAAQAVGTSSSAQSITLSNSGTAALNISSVQLGGSNAADFSFTRATACQNVLAAKASCSLSLVFSPATAGSRTASLIFVDNLANSPQTVAITGIGGAPQIALSSNALVFSNQPVGSASPATTMTISNSGSAPLNITSMALEGANAADFSMTSTCGAAIAMGASCSVSINFCAQRLGLRIATLTITDNALGSTQMVKLNGKGSVWATPTVWRPSNGTWYKLPISSGSPAVTQWGLPGDIPVPADYDGDGKSDIAVFRPSNGNWYVIPSSTSVPYLQQWALPGDIPVPGDYDGDGKSDIAVFRPSSGNWYVIPSSTSEPYVQQWGLPGDIPVPGDYDGDGKSDIAVFRPSSGNWYVIPSSTSEPYVKRWGLPGDTPVPGDYDGDGKSDVAVFRPSNGNWYIIPSSTSVPYVQQWGLPGDIPVPGDYDGDGKSDVTIFRPSDRTWWIVSSRTSVGSVQSWGLSGDIAMGSILK